MAVRDDWRPGQMRPGEKRQPKKRLYDDNVPAWLSRLLYTHRPHKMSANCHPLKHPRLRRLHTLLLPLPSRRSPQLSAQWLQPQLLSLLPWQPRCYYKRYTNTKSCFVTIYATKCDIKQPQRVRVTLLVIMLKYACKRRNAVCLSHSWSLSKRYYSFFSMEKNTQLCHEFSLCSLMYCK